MAKLFQLLPRAVKRHREKGVAILLTLGILSLTLVLALSFATTSMVDRKSALNYADLVRARMIAQSGVSRVIGLLEESMGDKLDTSSAFYQPTNATWNKRPVISSIYNHGTGVGGRDGIDEALSVALRASASDIVVFFPKPSVDTMLDANVGWSYITSVRDSSADGSFTPDIKIIARLAYMAEDASGHIDPGSWINGTSAEAAVTRTTGGNGTGYSMTDLNLRDAFEPSGLVDDLEAVSSSNSGFMPDNQKWHSYPHIFRGITNGGSTNATANADSIVSYMRPFRIGDALEKWWHDANEDNLMDIAGSDSEVMERIDLADVATAGTQFDMYNIFTGQRFQSSGGTVYDDVTKFSPWLKNIGDLGVGYDAAVLRNIAARTALNIMDYADTSNDADPHYIDATTYELKSGTPTGAYESIVHGTEPEFQIGEFLLAFRATRTPYVPSLLLGAFEVGMELVHPFSSSVNAGTGKPDAEFIPANYTMEITYSASVDGNGSTPNLVIAPITKEVPLGEVTDATPCTTAYSPCGLINRSARENTTIYATTTMELVSASSVSQFNFFVNDAADQSMTVNYVYLHDITLKKGGVVIDRVPEFYNSGYVASFIGPTVVTVKTPASGGAAFTSYAWCSYQAKDPLLNGFDQDHALASDFVTNASGILSGGVPPYWTPAAGGFASIGYANGSYQAPPTTWNQTTSDYGGVQVADAAFNDSEVAEIGRVKGWFPGRSLRLWSAVIGDVTGHDGYMIDMFKASNQTEVAGRVNLNVAKENVLKALFTGLAATPETAATNVIAESASAISIQSVGQLGGVSDLINLSASADENAEMDYLTKYANLSTVEQGFYNIIVAAQAIRETGNIPVTGMVQLTDAADPLGDRYGIVLAEQKIMATVYRNGFTNKFEVLRYEYIDE
jgi:hypothetical protein